MKKILLSLFALVVVNVFGQKCLTDVMLNEYHQNNPEKAIAFNTLMDDLSSGKYQQSGNKSTPTYIIPVVVHVLHYNGAGNISKTQIEDGIRVLNEDFQKLNSDTSSIRSVFKPYASDVEIEFRLAKKDLNGNCTEGITRTNTALTFDKRNEVKAVSYWNANKYLNVWLVNSIRSSGSTAGITLGYAQFPGSSSQGGGPINTYGLVVRHDQWGNTGTAQGTGGRTATHEIGHCLGLLHTFQSGCGSFCNISGDRVCDTPPAAQSTFGCNLNNNTCSNDNSGGTSSNPNPYNSNVKDMLENYMSYDDCQYMFTTGQKNRMHSALAGISHLQSLVTPSNLIATGTNTGYVAPNCSPVAAIIDTDKFGCVGDTITFSEDSYGGPVTNYLWTFSGGTPSSSTAANPTVTYSTPGNYDVVLRVSNSTGNSTTSLQSFVHINNGANAKYSAFAYNEGFENVAKFNSDWVITNPSSGSKFERSNFAANSGAASLWLNNFASSFATGKDRAISPSLKMTDVLNPSISMEIAYRRVTNADNDILGLFASIDCGNSWSNILSAGPSFFAFDNNTQNSNFVPSSSAHWKTMTIPSNFIPANIKQSDNVMFMLELSNGGGNNIYIDNFRINGQPTGVENQEKFIADLRIFPNPVSNGNVEISFNVDRSVEQVELNVTDIYGKEVKKLFNSNLNASSYRFNLSTEELAGGIYFVNFLTKGKRISKKLVVH